MGAIKKYLKDYFGYYTKSYSQEGEDLVLKRLFDNKRNGFFVDIGAHHPKRYSNTYYFYKRGWSGINIDGMPGIMSVFDKFRPRDTNLELIISDISEEVTFYIFKDHAYNTISKDAADVIIKGNKSELISNKTVKSSTLTQVLDKYCPANMQIDFYSIDIEGIDSAVLKSNDFSKYRPKVILLEIVGKSIPQILTQEPIIEWLKGKGYTFYSKTVNTLFFVDNNFISGD